MAKKSEHWLPSEAVESKAFPIIDFEELVDRLILDGSDLMSGSKVAALLLDNNLQIKRLTPLAAQFFNLQSTDLDRPISDISLGFNDDSLLNDCHSVLDKLVTIEKEIWTTKDESGSAVSSSKVSTGDENNGEPSTLSRGTRCPSESRCFLRRITPHQLQNHQIDGVVITLIDITGHVTAELHSRRLASALWNSTDAVSLLTFEGQLIAWSRGAEKLYGYTEPEALRMNIRDLIPEGHQDETVDTFINQIMNESSKTFETLRVAKNGRLIDVEATVSTYRDEPGGTVGVAMIEREISERKRLATTLEQLNDSLEQRVADQTRETRLLAKALSHLGEGVIITAYHQDRTDPRILFVNDAMCRISGYSVEELVGLPAQVLYGNCMQPEVVEQIQQDLAAGRSTQSELIAYRKDGTLYDAELFTTPLFDELGNRAHFVTILRDVSDRKRGERQIYESEERLRAILSTAGDAIITINLLGIITDVNLATSRIFGYTRAELLGRNISILMPPPYRDEHGEYLTRYLETGKARIIGIGREVSGMRKDGTIFPVDLAVSRVDHLGLYTGIVRDISYRKELERQVISIAANEQQRIGQELHDGTVQELTGLTLFADAMLDILNQKPQKATTASNNWLIEETDLTCLRQTAERLSRGLVESNRHVRDLAHDILPVQIEVEGLRSALEDLASQMHNQKKITCRFECPAPVKVADNTTATHLYRIAQEAVNNALRYSQGDQILISLNLVETEIVLEIADNGIGFDWALAMRSAPKRQPRGFGLGIMNYRAGIIGGRLVISHLEHGGTLVSCTVPQALGHLAVS